MVKFSAITIVLNGMPWLPYLLQNIYPFMDEIVMVEGAVEDAFQSATPDGHSIDDTVSVISSFPDPDQKIHLIQNEGFWQDKDVMFTAGTAACTGDYLWEFDVDEFYHPEHIQWIQQHLTEHPDITAVSFQSQNFYGGFSAIMKGSILSAYGVEEFWRIFKWGADYRYAQHEPPIVLDPQGQNVQYLKPMRQKHISMFHYSYVLPQQVLNKVKYYQYFRVFFNHHDIDTLDWYENTFLKLRPLHLQLAQTVKTHPYSWLEPFRGEHPPAIMDLLHDIESGKLAIECRPTEDIDRLLQSGRWRWWQFIGKVDVIRWKLFNRLIRPTFRPIVRSIRSRFLGYDYH